MPGVFVRRGPDGSDSLGCDGVSEHRSTEANDNRMGAGCIRERRC
jgi:hypothetical protein